MLTSDDAKNWATAAAIVVGGIWTLYQWNTLFPKTSSEVEISVADIRARTEGRLQVEIVPPPDGEQPMTSDARSFSDLCENDSGARVHIRFPVRLQLALTSNAPVAVRVAVTDFLIAPVSEDWASIADPAPAQLFSATTLGEVRRTPLDQAAFIGGLSWTHVEPDGQGALAVLGDAYFPFGCWFSGSSLTWAEFAIGLRAEIRPVRRDGSQGDEVAERQFFQLCKVNADGGSTCPPRGTAVAAEENAAPSGSTFKVIAQ